MDPQSLPPEEQRLTAASPHCLTGMEGKWVLSNSELRKRDGREVFTRILAYMGNTFSIYSFVYFAPNETFHVYNSSDRLYCFIRI